MKYFLTIITGALLFSSSFLVVWASSIDTNTYKWIAKLKTYQYNNITDNFSTTSYGSAVYIGQGRIITNAHVILDKDDKLITHLGEDNTAYTKEGWPNLPQSSLQVDKFNSPHGICVASNGDIYLVEWISYGRVTKLVRTGPIAATGL